MSSRAHVPSPSGPTGTWPSGRWLRSSCAGCLPVGLLWAPGSEAQERHSPLCPWRTDAAETRAACACVAA